MKFILFLSLLLTTLTAHAQVVPVRAGHTSQTHGTTNVTVAEASDFTAVADTSGSLAGTYLYFYNADNAVCYQPWFKVSGSGSAPTAQTGCTLVEIDIATNDTNTTVAGALRTALNTAPYSSYFTITGATTHLIVTSILKGSATDGNIGTSGFTVSKTQGVSGSAAIASASIFGNLVGFRICADAVQTSTYLAISNGTDPDFDGVRIGKGKCFECMDCRGGVLKLIKVSGQAASAAYNVVQYAP